MIDQQVKKEALAYENSANGTLLEIELMPWESDADAEFGAQVLREVKANFKSIDERRKEITVPLNAALNSVNGLFRPALDVLSRCEKNLKMKLAGYQERKELANRAALELAAVAPTAEEAREAVQLVDQSGPPKGTSVRYVTKFRVVNPELVPREYCSPDPAKIKAAAPGTVPGVEWFEEPIVSSRRA